MHTSQWKLLLFPLLSEKLKIETTYRENVNLEAWGKSNGKYFEDPHYNFLLLSRNKVFIAPRVSVLLNLKIKCYSLRRLNLVTWQRNRGNDFQALYLNLLWREFTQIGLLPQSRSTNPPPPDVVFSTVGYKICLPFTWGSRMVTYKRKIDIRWGTDFGFRLATDFLGKLMMRNTRNSKN